MDMIRQGWILAWVVVVPLSGQETLRIEDAVRRALAAHPILAAQTERIAAASGLVQQARLRPNPRIYLQSENWSITGADPISASVNSDQFGYFTQPIEIGGKRQRRVDLSQETLRLTNIERELLEKQISARVKQAYWAAVGAEGISRLWEEEVENLRQTIAYHEIRVREGALAEWELLRVRLEADRVAVSAAVAALEAERWRINLLREMGEAEIRPIKLVTPLAMTAPPVADIAVALEQRSDVKIARQEIERARANARLQRSLSRPDLEAGFGYKRNFGFNTLLATAQFNLPILNKNQGNIQAALSEGKAAEASLRALEANVRAEVVAGQREIESKRHQLLDVLAASKERADESSEIANAAYREGGADLLRLLDAQRVHIELEVLNLKTLTEYQQSIVVLEAALGVNP